MRNFSIRKTKTASGATAVQVVSYTEHRAIIAEHIGSAHTPEELAVLLRTAELYVEEHNVQPSLFPRKPKTKLLHVDHAHSLGSTHRFAREFFHACAKVCGLSLRPLFLDLAVIRIIEPSSKLRALELIDRYFGIRYSEHLYNIFKGFIEQKEHIEHAALFCARRNLNESAFLVLYDVTTLYFETFKADELRIHGFSKDDKSKQPQIVVGLLVTRKGFPLAHEVFPGKTFEGRTMLPVLEEFVEKHHVKTPVVVADAAMLSRENIKELEDRGIKYIVGARLANAPISTIKKISGTLNQQDGKVARMRTKAHGTMVCSFSLKRYRKDKREMEKQIERARRLIARKESGSRAKFVKKEGGAVSINESLIAKTKLLLGIKGYCTNIPEKDLSSSEVIARYGELWNVEHAFRMSKHDLETRPIFHRKEDAIRAHVLLCFASLMIGRYLEIRTGMSLRRIRDMVWNVTDSRIHDRMSGETFTFRSPMDEVLESPLGKLVTEWKIPH